MDDVCAHESKQSMHHPIHEPNHYTQLPNIQIKTEGLGVLWQQKPTKMFIFYSYLYILVINSLIWLFTGLMGVQY